MRMSTVILPAALLLASIVAPTAEAITLSLIPQTATAELGRGIDVDVMVSDLVTGGAPSLGAFDLDVHYDPAALSVIGMEEGHGLDLSQMMNMSTGSAFIPGLVNLFEVSLNSTDDLNALQPGAFRLFTITFKTFQLGLTSLGLTVNSLSSAEGTELTADTVLGTSFTVIPLGDTPPTTPTVPLPAAGWLLLSALGALGGFAKTRRLAS